MTKNRKFWWKMPNICRKFDEFLLKFWDWSGAKVCKSCRSRKMLKNAYSDAKIGVDTAENEPNSLTLGELSLIFSFPFYTLSPEYQIIANFSELVLLCIEADFCTQIRIFQHFSRSTRFSHFCTASICKIRFKRRSNFCKICWNFEICAVRRIANLVDLEKCWKMSIWLQKSASIQPRTSLLKFDDLARSKVRYRILHLRPSRPNDAPGAAGLRSRGLPCGRPIT